MQYNMFVFIVVVLVLASRLRIVRALSLVQRRDLDHPEYPLMIAACNEEHVN
jgi:hypothetical protein